MKELIKTAFRSIWTLRQICLGLLLVSCTAVLLAFLPVVLAQKQTWGTPLGETFNGVQVYSNGAAAYYRCTSHSKDCKNYVRGTYTGVKWQCVEFIRRYYW